MKNFRILKIGKKNPQNLREASKIFQLQWFFWLGRKGETNTILIYV